MYCDIFKSVFFRMNQLILGVKLFYKNHQISSENFLYHYTTNILPQPVKNCNLIDGINNFIRWNYHEYKMKLLINISQTKYEHFFYRFYKCLINIGIIYIKFWENNNLTVLPFSSRKFRKNKIYSYVIIYQYYI